MICGTTRTYALLGHPVAQSPSPRLHTAWFSEHGLDAVYVALDTVNAPPTSVVPSFRHLGLAGANVTVPLKEVAARGVDRLEEPAARAGAVNTLWWDGDCLVGANTDGDGFVLALRDDGHDLGDVVAIIGAGGAARGIAAACLQEGVGELRILNRTPDRARRTVEELRIHASRTELRAEAIAGESLVGADLVIVTTPPEAELPPMLSAHLEPGALWYDIGYRHPEPKASTAARAQGLTVGDGWGMLVWQAALAFERWTGARPDARAARSQQP